MVQSRMPYQCMAKLANVLLAARGSSIDSLSLTDGTLLSTWTCPPPPNTANIKQVSETKPEVSSQPDTKPALENSESSVSVEITLQAEEPPAKKRRITKDDAENVPKVMEVPSKDAEEVVKEEKAVKNGEKKAAKEPKKKPNNRSEAVASGLEAPAVTTLVISEDGKHVVAVTGEDKSIRVFENVLENEKHSLKQLSTRPMPKRPCALILTPDASTIISADKFGDVYALPLIHTEATPLPPNTSSSPSEPEPIKTFAPTANEFTIHSLRNRKALENQRRQPAPLPTVPALTHQFTLLLGHVSMLTDLILASSEGRQYIITADRDEHIRVSRGIPQTHVIEGYCLGHTDFISRLCIPSTHPSLLISGGGDDELFLWTWKNSTLHSKINIASHINSVLGKEGESAVKPAISSIQHIAQSSSGSGSDIVVVTAESVPAIFIFTLLTGPTPHLQHTQTIALPSNALSLITLPDRLLVSLDTVHVSGLPVPSAPVGKYKKEVHDRRAEGDVVDPVLLFRFDGENFGAGESFVKAQAVVDGESEKEVEGRLENLLYNLENLRKKEGENED